MMLERNFRSLSMVNDMGFITLKLERFYSQGGCVVLSGCDFNIKIPINKIRNLTITRRTVTFEFNNTEYVLM